MAISDQEIRSTAPEAEVVPSRDRDLVVAHQSGDPQAFCDIVHAYYPTLYAQAMRRLRERSAAEDAVQDTFLRAYRGLDRFNGDYRLQPWLHRIMANVCADEGNRRRREAVAAQRWSVEPEGVVPSLEENSLSAEAARHVAQAIAQLPANYREALVLRDLMELEYADVADRAGISEENARARVHRAREALKRLVGGSTALGGFAWRGLRRVSRWAPRVAQHVSNTANAMSEVVNMQARTGYSVATIATTSAAVAVASAVPIIAITSSGPPPKPAPPPIAAPAPAGTTQVSVAAAGAQATLPAVVATSTTVMTTTTTVPATTTTLAGGGAVGSAVGAIAELTGGQIPTDSGGGMTEELATLTIGSQSPVDGRLITQLTLPSSDRQPCTGSMKARFLWSDGSSTTAHQVTMTTSFLSATKETGDTVYQLNGTADVTGTTGSFSGNKGVTATLTVPADGSDGKLSLKFVNPDQVSPAPTCGSPTTSTVAPSASSTTTTTAPPPNGKNP